MTNYEQFQSQERPGYYQPQQQGYNQPQQYMPPVAKQSRGLVVAAFVCATIEFALVLIAFTFAAASLSGIAGFFLVLSFLLVVVTPILLLILIAKK